MQDFNSLLSESVRRDSHIFSYFFLTFFFSTSFQTLRSVLFLVQKSFKDYPRAMEIGYFD